MSATETASLRLNRLEIQNYLRVEALQVEADGQHVFITGPNGSGKTSAVNAIWHCLAGASGRDLPEPIHQGAGRASVRLDLGDLVVERIWSEKGARLVVTAADGSKVAKPQQLLDGLLASYALDPVAFLDQGPVAQIADVLATAGVAPPVDQVQAILGTREPARPDESAAAYLDRLAADDGVIYLRRREAGRALDKAKAALASERQQLQALGGAPKGGEQVSASDVLQQLADLQKLDDAGREMRGRAATTSRELAEATALLESIEAEIQRDDQAIADLEAELARRRSSRAAKTERVARGKAVIAELEHDDASARTAVAALPDYTGQIDALRKRLKAIEQDGAQIAKRRLLAEAVAKSAASVQEAEKEHGRLEAALHGLRDLRTHLLDGADLGVDGLEVGQGELRLNGVPFRQASQAEQIRTACAVAMRQRPKLRLLRVDDGEHLDRKSRELLFRLADEHGWQIVYTAVADTEALRVEIIDREAK